MRVSFLFLCWVDVWVICICFSEEIDKVRHWSYCAFQSDCVPLQNQYRSADKWNSFVVALTRRSFLQRPFLVGWVLGNWHIIGSLGTNRKKTTLGNVVSVLLLCQPTQEQPAQSQLRHNTEALWKQFRSQRLGANISEDCVCSTSDAIQYYEYYDTDWIEYYVIQVVEPSIAS